MSSKIDFFFLQWVGEGVEVEEQGTVTSLLFYSH